MTSLLESPCLLLVLVCINISGAYLLDFLWCTQWLRLANPILILLYNKGNPTETS